MDASKSTTPQALIEHDLMCVAICFLVVVVVVVVVVVGCLLLLFSFLLAVVVVSLVDGVVFFYMHVGLSTSIGCFFLVFIFCVHVWTNPSSWS